MRPDDFQSDGQKMLRKALKLFGWFGMGVLVLAVVAFVAVSNNEALQDRLVAVGVQNNVAAGLVDDWGGDNLEVAFAARHRPWAMVRARNNASLFFAGDKFFIVDAARVPPRAPMK